MVTSHRRVGGPRVLIVAVVHGVEILLYGACLRVASKVEADDAGWEADYPFADAGLR